MGRGVLRRRHARGARAHPGEFRAGLLILVPVAAYLLSHQLVHRNSPWRAPKELCVAVLLGAGAAAFTASRPGVRIEAMAAPLGLFVLLCFTNCALISVWEDEVDRIHGQTSLALQFARAPVLCRALPWAISLASGAAWLLGAEGRAAACAAASGDSSGARRSGRGEDRPHRRARARGRRPADPARSPAPRSARMTRANPGYRPPGARVPRHGIPCVRAGPREGPLHVPRANRSRAATSFFLAKATGGAPFGWRVSRRRPASCASTRARR
jgi:hypothetical protein